MYFLLCFLSHLENKTNFLDYIWNDNWKKTYWKICKKDVEYLGNPFYLAQSRERAKKNISKGGLN